MMDYSQTLAYLFERLPMFTRIGAAAYRKDLTNTIALLESIGNPQHRFKSIHVAGTNGKGSTSHMLAAIFQTAGYKTGLYTSPHLRDFRERIRIDGVMIPEPRVIDFVARIQPVADRIDPSFFEVTVAMAFDHFADEEVDIAIIEVGLGGRLDSTNIITPELSVITQIGFDHMNLLGNTLPEIAGEKAGIIKPGVPVVIGEFDPVTAPVFEEKAAAMNAPMSYADKSRFVAEWSFDHHFLVAEVTAPSFVDKEYYHLDLPGLYQTQNLLTVLESIHVLAARGWRFTRAQVHQALRQVRKLTGLRGRWELIHEHPSIVLDVAHNEDGVRQVVRQIELTDHENVHIVFGMVRDKEIDGVLDLLPKQAVYYFTRARLPRSLPEEELSERATERGLRGNTYATVMDALGAAKEHAHARDLILVCGSVFVVGEVEG